MNITTFSNPSSYTYNGMLATYFSDTTFGDGINPIDKTLKNGELWMADPLDFNDPFDCRIQVSKIHSTNQNLTIEEINEIFIKGLGIRCFVRDDKTHENDQLMWSHYTNKGNGICMVFDPEKDLELFSPNDVIGVEYVKQAPPLIHNNNIELWAEIGSDFKKTKCYSFGLKGTPWKYENEIRLVKECCPHTVRFLYESINEVGYVGTSKLIKLIFSNKLAKFMRIPTVRNYEFKKESLVEIRFGHNMADPRIQEIKDILNKNGYSHVKCLKSSPNSKLFRIDYIECNVKINNSPMTDSQKHSLKKELEIMVNIANYAKECSFYYHRLRIPGENIFIQSPDIDFLKSVLFNTMVLEVCKLFKVNTSSNDRHLLIKLINRFQSGDFKDNELYEFCSKEYNTFTKSELTDKFLGDSETLVKVSHEDFIENIILLRDKQIAHLDKEEEIELGIQFSDILIGLDHFIDFACQLLEQLYFKVFNETITYESAYFGKTNFEMFDAFIEKKSQL